MFQKGQSVCKKVTLIRFWKNKKKKLYGLMEKKLLQNLQPVDQLDAFLSFFATSLCICFIIRCRFLHNQLGNHNFFKTHKFSQITIIHLDAKIQNTNQSIKYNQILFHSQNLQLMCQCLVCDCWWINYCGVCRGGWYHAYICCSYWLCMPRGMKRIDPECCKTGCCVGWGYNHCWFGSVCCASESLKAYSKSVTNGVDDVVVLQNIYVNQQQPMMNMTQQPLRKGY